MIRSFVKNGRLMSLAIILLIVSGLGALSTMPRMEDPRMENRHASVLTRLPGASAERIEVLITEKIEQKLRKISEIKNITSVSRPGISSVKLELHDEVTNSLPIWSRVRDLINDVAPQFPPNTLPPTLEDDRSYAFTQLIALNWQGDSPSDIASLGRYANDLQNRLRIVTGTDLVSIFGHGQEEVLVEIEQGLNSKLNLSSKVIAQKIQQSDAKVSAGQLVNQKNQMQVELNGAFNSVTRIENIPIKGGNSGTILRLGDIAKVSKNLAWPAQEMAIVNDKPAVVVAARMLPNLRIDQWSANIKEALAQYAKQLPQTIELEVLFDQNTYTEKRLGDLVDNIALGFILISTVLLVTLGWRSAAIVAASLPLTVLFTLSVMNFYGIPIHQMSVTGLVVALGIMVDNAIVMTDTIQTKRQEGMNRLDSVSFAVKHLWLPLLGSTITTILAFMPLILMPGSAGEFVGGIAYSVIFSLIGSYIISHTIVAGLAGRFIPRGIASGGSIKTDSHWYQVGIHLPKLNQSFEKGLHWALTYKKITIITVFGLPLLGFVLSKHLSEQFFPPSDRDMFQIELFMPTQSSILNTQVTSQQISDYLYQQQGIEKVRWFLGKNAPSFYYNLTPTKDGFQNYGQAMITTTDFQTANNLIPKLQSALDELIPQAQILVRKLEQGPPFNAPVELRVYGPNLDTLKVIGDDIRKIMTQTTDIIHTRVSLQPGTPKVWVNADEEAAALLGLSLVDIAEQLQGNLSGQVSGSIIEATESIPVRVRLANEDRSTINDLANINLLSPSVASNAQPIPLTAIADFSLKPSRGAIPHRNGSRVNVIEGYIRSGVLPSVVLTNVSAKIAAENYQLPAGYKIEIGGESSKRNDAVGKLLASVGVIFTLLITVVVLSFNSFRLGGIIFFSALQSVGLGLLTVYIFGYPFGFTVIIALLGLMGLAINAAIVIIAELKSDAQAVQGNPSAIIRGVQNCTRHITSTTITTVGGFLPLILAGGGFWPPFAIAIAGGTVLTTLLSFLFVPAAFSWFCQRRAFELNEQT
ncbi:efflux RND transporter permease subunit [Candidatus Colwellia aromaticivorans]|uniref:efflux RND transporter permease subunit n=1 Tax=Candidatus Colwellia aromaticivorans TaxID=2267621 RepID=UPI000DF2D072|nr:efflux RND transporter permease subunit [Candidatus Colwellia aromaticivorans]